MFDYFRYFFITDKLGNFIFKYVGVVPTKCLFPQQVYEIIG